jgi:hypothetical protein
MAGFFRQFPDQVLGYQREIVEPAAGFTAEMGMMRQSAIKPVPAPGGFEPPGGSGIHQNVEVAVYRPETHFRMFFQHGQVNLFGGGMVCTVFQVIQNACPDSASSVSGTGRGIDKAYLLKSFYWLSIILRLLPGSISI